MAVRTRRTVGELEVVVHESPAALAQHAAFEAAAALRRAVDQRGVAHAMFATGNSQLAFVEALLGGAASPRAADPTTAQPVGRSSPGSTAKPSPPPLPAVPWEQVIVFHMDEYVGAAPNHPAGFQRWMRERIVEPADPRGAHYLDGRRPPDLEAARYAELLSRHPLDLCCLGIGENGHLAFNDPPVADFADPLDVKVVELDAACRAQQVGEGHFPDLAAVPTHAITVTIPALLRARRVLVVVPEARKAVAVAAALTGPITTACPASVLRQQSNALLLLEPASAARLDWVET